MGRTARSPITGLLRRLQQAGRTAEQEGIPFDDALSAAAAPPERRALTRRRFLGAAGAAGATVGLGALAGPLGIRAAAAPSVGIVGGGAAGLACAVRLSRFGIPSTVFEAADRLGGRIFTSRGFFDGGAVVERGGEFISSEHRFTRRLARSLGLDLEVVDGGAFQGGGEEVYFVDGRYYTAADAQRDWSDGKLWQIFQSAIQAAPYPPTFDSSNPEHRRLDRLNLPDWLDEVGIGSQSRMGKLLQTDAVVEYGPEAGDQTCLNLIYIVGYNGPSLQPLAGTDEVFHIVGGNDRLIDRAAAALPAGSVLTSRPLVAITGSLDGPYTLHFDTGAPATFDVVVLALPFTTLRDVAIDARIRDGFRPAKRLAIDKLFLGPNAKLHVQTDGRPWVLPLPVPGQAVVGNGVAYSDPADFICTWDATAADTTTTRPVLTNFLGGAQGERLQQPSAFAPAGPSDVQRFLERIERVFPGTTAAAGRQPLALGSVWARNPWSRGAYFSPLLGDYTTFFGAPGLQEGKLFFCGEHTELDAFGFIEGAVQTGELAAQAIHTQF